MDILIKPSELVLFTAFLHDLQDFRATSEVGNSLYVRWRSRIETITEIAGRLDDYLKMKDEQAAREVRYAKQNAIHSDDYTVYEKHIPYYLAGIMLYQQEEEAELIQTGLFDKRIQEMTGLEFKTLIIATLAEYEQRRTQP